MEAHTYTLTIPQFLSKMSGRPFHRIRNAPLQRMSDGRSKVSIDGIACPTFFSIGSRCSMGDPYHGCIDDTVLSRGGILETLFSMGLANV